MSFTERPIHAKITAAFNLEWYDQNKIIDERPTYMLYFRVKGSSKITYDGGVMTIDAGDVVLFPKNYAYRHECEYEKMYSVRFDSSDVITEKIIKFTPKNPNYLKDKFFELFTVWSEKKPGYEYKADIALYKILYEIEREKSEMIIDRLADVLEYLHENFTDPSISVEKLAEMCAMSDTYFRRLFKERLGENPSEYISDLRLVKAKELLESGYYSVEQVSELCGFNNVNYFSLFFKRKTGSPPSVYKSNRTKS